MGDEQPSHTLSASRSEMELCEQSGLVDFVGSYSGSRRPGGLHGYPEFLSNRCYGSGDLSPFVSLAEQNFHVLDRWVVAFAMQLLHDFANLLSNLLLAAH